MEEICHSFGFGTQTSKDILMTSGMYLQATYDKLHGKIVNRSLSFVAFRKETGCTPLHLANLCYSSTEAII